jgi:prolyl-tRNA synthetase
MFKRALEFRSKNIFKTNDYREFKDIIREKGGFIMAHWDGTAETENHIKEETKATIRCIPMDAEQENGKCIYSGKPSSQRVLFAKAY